MKLIRKLITASALLIASSVSAQHHPTLATSPFSQSLTEAYLALQDSLAQDDLSGAHDATLHYIAAFDKSTAELNVENLTRHADEIASAGTLQAARTAFKPLSKQATMLLDYLSTSASAPLYVVRCGMAFEGQGAEWIQASQDISNPYYGASMSNCGSVTRRIGTSATQTSGSADSCSHEDRATQSCDHASGGSCCSK